MTNNYTFLTDHSYSLRPVSEDEDNDNEALALKSKKKTSRRSSNRTNKTISSKTHRTVSIDRSSSDKENNSTSHHSITKSKRTSTVNPRKKQLTNRKKISTKKTAGAIVKRTKPINRQAAKQFDLAAAPPSLSIEERVKLRRTSALPPATSPLPKQSQTATKKRSKTAKSQTPIAPKKSTKLFLGSGLDLDNIVSGNRQRRSAPT